LHSKIEICLLEIWNDPSRRQMLNFIWNHVRMKHLLYSLDKKKDI